MNAPVGVIELHYVGTLTPDTVWVRHLSIESIADLHPGGSRKAKCCLIMQSGQQHYVLESSDEIFELIDRDLNPQRYQLEDTKNRDNPLESYMIGPTIGGPWSERIFGWKRESDGVIRHAGMDGVVDPGEYEALARKYAEAPGYRLVKWNGEMWADWT